MNRAFTAPDVAIEALQVEKQLVEQTFATVHQEAGYQATPEQAPYPSPDPTVLFVGAQISLWKPRLEQIRSGQEAASFCPQDCIRLQNKDQLLTDEPITFNSAFRICGAVATAGSFGSMVNTAERFLGRIGVDPERIVIRSTGALNSLFDTTSHVETDSRPDKYYRWGYGEAELSGAGLTFAIRSEHTPEAHDIGNVIEIRKGGEPMVVEWGTGIETLLSAVHSDGLPVRYATITDELRNQFSTPQAIKYADAVATALQISRFGVRSAERGPGGVLREYMQGLAYLAIRLDKFLPTVEAEVTNQADLRQIPNEAREAVLDRVRYYIGRLRYLTSLVDETSPKLSIAKKVGVADNIAKLLLNNC